MLRLNPSHPVACTFALAGAWLVLGARDAHACGGCFHPPRPPQEVDGTLVTDHRMAFSISPAQTVLWDQIRYSGNPKDFAWVLPVRPGARIELSHDEWIAALDANTQTVVIGPTPSCGGAPPISSGGGGGCAFGGMSSASTAAGFTGADLVDAGGGQVQVISQQVVGPYDAVTVRSSQGDALGEWMRANGYEVPLSIQPTIDAYSAAGFDFIALKLAPAVGVQAMQPVRVVSPGADPTLPLRMVAAGVGAHVGLELYVLSEGRYHPANFPDATIDFRALAWDPTQSRSNYTELARQALAASNGTGWLTESSQPAELYGFGAVNPGLSATYTATCRPLVFTPTCTVSAGDASMPSDGDAGDAVASQAPDAGDDGGDGAVSADAGRASLGGRDAAACAQMVTPCDDLSLAMTGIAAGNLWVTRLRADLPTSALSADLVIEATASQTPVSSLHQTNSYTIANYNPCPQSSSNAASSPSSAGGCACRTAESPGARFADTVVLSLSAAGILLSMRRRRRSRR
jgi:MYXO-CTERM domain-containing protein